MALRRERVAQAKELLINEDDPVGTVDMRVGYRDASSFIRAFRDLVGQTPARWRRETRRQATSLLGAPPSP